MRRSRFVLSVFVLAVAACVPARAAHAQGKGHGRGHGAPPGHAKKQVVTTDRAIVVTREVLVSHGYEFVRVERLGEARVIYYRRGNMGRGKGKGPVERIVVRPAQERVVFEAAPRPLLVDINLKLGL